MGMMSQVPRPLPVPPEEEMTVDCMGLEMSRALCCLEVRAMPTPIQRVAVSGLQLETMAVAIIPATVVMASAVASETCKIGKTPPFEGCALARMADMYKRLPLWSDTGMLIGPRV
mmetsp:Transcript_707/g.1200  ORF Transcript_707/g.1200 Transcript_707/m.1200 type:complete len:115 (+) Transcript_707:703-1047(+)